MQFLLNVVGAFLEHHAIHILIGLITIAGTFIAVRKARRSWEERRLEDVLTASSDNVRPSGELTILNIHTDDIRDVLKSDSAVEIVRQAIAERKHGETVLNIPNRADYLRILGLVRTWISCKFAAAALANNNEVPGYVLVPHVFALVYEDNTNNASLWVVVLSKKYFDRLLSFEKLVSTEQFQFPTKFETAAHRVRWGTHLAIAHASKSSTPAFSPVMDINIPMDLSRCST
jgi:hypothetical protein